MNQVHSITASLPLIIAMASPEDTALLIADVRVLIERLDLLTQAFPTGTQHAVAIKTNPHKQILAAILAHGFDLEAASIEEVELAFDAGAKPQNIVFDSPVKTRTEIERCSSYTGMQVNANMLCELQRYPAKPECQLGLRINPGIDTGAPEMFAVSTDESKFGIPLAAESEPQQSVMRRYAAQVTKLAAAYPGYQLRTEFGQWTQRAAGFALTKAEAHSARISCIALRRLLSFMPKTTSGVYQDTSTFMRKRQCHWK